MSGQAVRNSALLSVAALASRLLGWVRLIVLVAAFGVDGRLDPYLAAFKIPDIIYQLIAAGPLASVLVPVIVRLRGEGDELRARRLMSAIFLIFGALAIVISVLALLLSSQLAVLLAPGIDLAQREEVAQLSRILAPSSLGLGVVAVASVWSAANERFFASSIGPIIYNLTVILFTLFGADRFGTTAAAVGTVVGALLFGVIAIADARRGGMRFAAPLLKDSIIGTTLRALMPRISGLLVVQVVLTGLVAVASTLGPGSITAWTYALSLVQLPLAMVAGSIGTAILPVAARVLHAEGPGGLLRVTRAALGAAIWMLLPIAVIGASLAANPVGFMLGISATSPVGALLYPALSLLLFSLPMQGAISVVTRLCYGAGDTRGPVGASIVGSLLIAVSAAPFVALFGFSGLAVAVLFGEAIECVVLLARLRSHVGGHLLREVAVITLMSLLGASAALGASLALSGAGALLLPSGSIAVRAAVDAVAASAGLLLYLALSARLRIAGSEAPLAAITRLVTGMMLYLSRVQRRGALSMPPRAREQRISSLIARLDQQGLLVAGDQSGHQQGDLKISAPPTHDSRLVQPGGLFVAIAGQRADGATFAAEAFKHGAVAMIGELPAMKRLRESETSKQSAVLITVTNARRALAEASAWWEGDPAEEVSVIGVTGTDGKTTTSTYLSTALSAAGLSAGLISTALQRVGGKAAPMMAHQTTPEAPALQSQLRKIATAGDRAAVLETTSHGLALDRVAAINYAAGIVTNFTSDHLDLHGTIDEYRRAKLLLVDRVRGSAASRSAGLVPLMVIRRADPALAPFVAAAEAAGIRVVDFDVADDGALLLNGARHKVSLRMPGRINALNAAAALALVAAWGLPLAPAIAAVSAEPGPPGRSEVVDAGQPFKVIVDFAHTGPSLTAAIGVARALVASNGRLLLVTGAAGERDPGRRTAVGQAATAADRIWITDEDPRGEDPNLIAAAIRSAALQILGAEASERVITLHDRRAAISAAISAATMGDVVLLAGKGHEQTIERNGRDERWDEVAAAREALAALGYPQRT